MAWYTRMSLATGMADVRGVVDDGMTFSTMTVEDVHSRKTAAKRMRCQCEEMGDTIFVKKCKKTQTIISI
jgi:hypothetical protein